MEANRRLLNLWLFLAVGALAAGCGRFGAVSGGKELTLGYIPENDPVAYEFIRSISLDEEQVNPMEAEINEAGSNNPEKGVNTGL